jgi:serine/threonine-protein kinase CTR1
VELEH